MHAAERWIEVSEGRREVGPRRPGRESVGVDARLVRVVPDVMQ